MTLVKILSPKANQQRTKGSREYGLEYNIVQLQILNASDIKRPGTELIQYRGYDTTGKYYNLYSFEGLEFMEYTATDTKPNGETIDIFTRVHIKPEIKRNIKHLHHILRERLDILDDTSLNNIFDTLDINGIYYNKNEIKKIIDDM